MPREELCKIDIIMRHDTGSILFHNACFDNVGGDKNVPLSSQKWRYDKEENLEHHQNSTNIITYGGIWEIWPA